MVQPTLHPGFSLEGVTNTVNNPEEFAQMDPGEILALWARLMAEMRRRGIIRNNNNPLGDFAEDLVCRSLGLQIAQNQAQQGFDATDAQKVRYQIKSRRTLANAANFSTIKVYEDHLFDQLILVMFNLEFQPTRAAMIPYRLVPQICNWNNANNGLVPRMPPQTLQIEGVVDILPQLRGH